ncbi:YraN family protein [Leeia oryzae]|uniref:YraN family protein n=1 Tax=Leeia oryzae TaxID=356662 RepID=UPI00035CE5C4|nr:YraN family protein [Leeia oryzae]
MSLVAGHSAEQLAALYLQQQGLKLLTRNYRCRFGEIDLIMQDGKTLVFVEVRARKSKTFGGAVASVTASKQQKLILTAQSYLSTLRHLPACRFDVVGFEGQDAPPHWIRHAFEPSA